MLNVMTVYTGHNKNLWQNTEKEIYEFWQDTLKNETLSLLCFSKKNK